MMSWFLATLFKKDTRQQHSPAQYNGVFLEETTEPVK
jgi:hypothetical protein